MTEQLLEIVSITDETRVQTPTQEHFLQGMECYQKSLYDKAITILGKAAVLNHPIAALQLVKIYEQEKTECEQLTQPYKEKSVQNKQWFVKQAQSEDAEAHYWMGVFSEIMDQDYSVAIKWYHKSAAQNYAPAQNAIADCFRFGGGVPSDSTQEFCWCKKAAEQGYIVAMYNLGISYRDGDGVPEDLRKAKMWFLKAAEQGHVDAQYELSSALKKERNWEQMIYWCQTAAENGDPDARCELGLYYRDGVGVPTDVQKAVYWFRQAVDRSHSVAHYYLGQCYEYGEGVEQDLQKALELYRKASKNAYRRLKQVLKSDRCSKDEMMYNINQ